MAAADVAKYLYKPMVFSPAPATSTGRCPFCHNGSSTNTSVVVLNQFLTQPLRKPCSCMLTPKVAPSSRIAYWLAYRDPSSYFCSSTGARGSVRR
ncbi:uncharacterized protein [Aegilops tauschii subsp. strangulata]